MLEPGVDDTHRAGRAKWRPVGLEVAPLEPGAADLFCEETIHDRVVDVLEELAVDLPVDRAQTAVGVDLKDRNARATLSGCLVRQRIEPSGREQGERKPRGFHHDLSPEDRVSAGNRGARHRPPA